MNIRFKIADSTDNPYAEEICRLIEESAKVRGTGIAKRDPKYIRKKLEQGDAVVAYYGTKLAGFCYMETWGHGRYVSNSGLIVNPELRQHGLARKIKKMAFDIDRESKFTMFADFI